MASKEPEDSAQRQLNAMSMIQIVGDLGKRYIRCRLDQYQDLVAECVDPMGSNIAAGALGGPTASLLPAANPLDRGRDTNAEPLRCCPTRHPVVYRCNNPFTQIVRKGSRRMGWPPSPALIVNHNSRFMGIPELTPTPRKML